MTKLLTKRQWTFVSIFVFFILFTIFVLPVSLPLILAFLTALFLNPIINIIGERFHLNRKLSCTIVYLIFLIVVFGLGAYLITILVTQLISLVENAPVYILQINQMILAWSSDLETIMEDFPVEFVREVNLGINTSVDSASNLLRDALKVNRLASFFVAVPTYIVSIIVYLIALFLFMIELPMMKAKVFLFFSEQTRERVQFMTSRLKSVLLGFLKAQFLVSLIILLATLIALFIIIPDYAIIMATIIWMVDLIPIIGSIAVLAPWAIYMFIAGNTLMGTQLAILAIILLAIRRTVEPKVMGQHIGLSPLATLIAMYIGLQLIGILGFIVGPLVVIAFTSAKEAGFFKFNFKV